jgi:hypothetical protein
VQHDYQYFLHRAADAAGLANWTGARQHGMRDEQIAAAIVGSPEYTQSVQLQQTLLPSPPVAGVPVIVVNTPSQPVPVTGIVTGTVTGTVQAQQSGPWTVGISGTPTVQVASSLTNPVFVRDVNSVAQPFRIELLGIDMIANPVSFTVPAKRLVIQDVSVGATVLPLGARGFFRLDTGIDFLDIPTTFAYREGNEFDRLVGHEQATFSIDPGTVVKISAEFPRLTSVRGFMSISGYLVNVP